MSVEDRRNLEAACKAHGWKLLTLDRDRVLGDRAQAVVRFENGVLLTVHAPDPEAALRLLVEALVSVGGVEVFEQ